MQHRLHVGGLEKRHNLERQLIRILQPRLDRGFPDQRRPLLPGLGDRVPHPPWPRTELRLHSGEEAPTGKSTTLGVVQPPLAQRPQPRKPRRLPKSRRDHRVDKNLRSSPHSGQLQLFLRSEVSKNPTLAHVQLGSQPPDGQPLKPLHRGDVSRPTQDQPPSLLPTLNTTIHTRHDPTVAVDTQTPSSNSTTVRTVTTALGATDGPAGPGPTRLRTEHQAA